VERSDALAVFARAGVDFDLVALGHEQRHRHFHAGRDFGWLHDFAGGVAFDGGLGPSDLAHHAGRQFNRDGFLVVEHDFEFHAVFEVVQGVTHVGGFDFVLVEVGVHANVHRVSKVRVGALFLVQNDLVHLVISTENHFGTEVGDQAFELHANGGRATTATLVFGAQDDHGVFAVHDDVANADFLSGFHRNLSLK
jgi:hypothetical protein